MLLQIKTWKKIQYGPLQDWSCTDPSSQQVARWNRSWRWQHCNTTSFISFFPVIWQILTHSRQKSCWLIRWDFRGKLRTSWDREVKDCFFRFIWFIWIIFLYCMDWVMLNHRWVGERTDGRTDEGQSCACKETTKIHPDRTVEKQCWAI